VRSYEISQIGEIAFEDSLNIFLDTSTITLRINTDPANANIYLTDSLSSTEKSGIPFTIPSLSDTLSFKVGLKDYKTSDTFHSYFNPSFLRDIQFNFESKEVDSLLRFSMETFKIRGVYKIKIYDRWGELLIDYQNIATSDLSSGSIDIAQLGSGTFAYVFKLGDIQYTGNIVKN